MSVKSDLDEYINGTDGDIVLPSARHVSMLNFLFGAHFPAVVEAMEWHKRTYPNEELYYDEEIQYE